MDAEDKRAAAEAYYHAIDNEAFDVLFDLIADDIEYVTAHGTMRSADEMVAYYTDSRAVTNTTHDTFRYVVDDDTLIAEGRVRGEYVDDGSFDGGYVGVFEFDEDGGVISRLNVYTRSVF